jgi:acetate kinase
VGDAILTLNAGSSSLKFTVFVDAERPELLAGGQYQSLTTHPRFSARDAAGTVVGEHDWGEGTTLAHKDAIDHLVAWGRSGVLGGHAVSAIGHRVVHGGIAHSGPVRIDAHVADALDALVPLAPSTFRIFRKPLSVMCSRAGPDANTRIVDSKGARRNGTVVRAPSSSYS